MQVQLITPEKTLYADVAKMVVVPGTEGDFGVLPGHAPFISTLRPGIITVDTESNNQRKFAVVSGVAEATPERCTILAESAVDCTGLSSVDAQTQLAAAKTALEAAETETATKDATAKLALAEAVMLAV